MKGTVPLSDAARLSGPLVSDLMLKPVGSSCNLGCSYCYYLDKPYDGRRMSEEVLDAALRAFFAAVEAPEVNIVWHGGEPLLAGLDFFQRAMQRVQRYADGRLVHHSIQTNGTLLDAAWARFFREHHFLVGLSLDGPADLHNGYRRFRGGAPAFDKVLSGLEILRSHDVPFNTLTTVNHASEGRGAEVYTFLKGAGSHYMQFLPVVEWNRPALSVSARGFGQFMVDIFDVWVRSDIGRYYVQLFDSTLAAWCGQPAAVCTLGTSCSGNLVVEHNGDLYQCDHFVAPPYRLGNVLDLNEGPSLQELLSKETAVRFTLDKYAGLPPRCRRCPYLPACHGECPVHRFPTGENALCEGYRLFFDHTAPSFDRMRALLAAGRTPAELCGR